MDAGVSEVAPETVADPGVMVAAAVTPETVAAVTAANAVPEPESGPVALVALAEAVAPVVAAPPLPGPDPALQADLWAAAAMISKAAEVAPPRHREPVSVVQVAPPPPVAAPAPASAAPTGAPPQTSDQQGTSPYAVPANIAAARQGPDAMHWIMLGSAAVFLFIVWMAIYFGFRW
jgi:hypothetical protein